ncbi:MAG: histidine kinase, partial [Chloroflexi bacterium]|nr:histidine kinase [Chloroflexota bacterium]
MAPSRLSLAHDLFMAAFPFHVAFDSALRIVQAGHVLRRLCPDVTDGGRLQESFTIKRPNVRATFEGIQEQADSLFILESLSNGMLLKGQMLPDAGQQVIMFLCSPWLTDLSSAKDLGLSLGDFAIHDPVADFLFLLQTKNTALADVNSLAEKLRQQRAELQRAHDDLEDLVQERTA